MDIIAPSFLYTHILINIYITYKLKKATVTLLSFIPLVLTFTHFKSVSLYYSKQSVFIPLFSS